MEVAIIWCAQDWLPHRANSPTAHGNATSAENTAAKTIPGTSTCVARATAEDHAMPVSDKASDAANHTSEPPANKDSRPRAYARTSSVRGNSAKTSNTKPTIEPLTTLPKRLGLISAGTLEDVATSATA